MHEPKQAAGPDQHPSPSHGIQLICIFWGGGKPDIIHETVLIPIFINLLE